MTTTTRVLSVALVVCAVLALWAYGLHTRSVSDQQQQIDAAEARADSAIAAADALAEQAEADALRAARSAEQADALALVNRALSDQLAASRQVLVSMQATLSRAQASADDALRRSDDRPASVVLAREALAACSVARGRCGALVDSQRVVIADQDALVAGQAAQIAQMDTTRTYDLRQIHYQRLRGDSLIAAVSAQREVIDGTRVQLRQTRRQRDVARAAVVAVATGALYLVLR